MPARRSATDRLAEAVEREGVLLVHDKYLPSATRVVVGSPVAGSWWSHPMAHDIFDALQPVYHDAARVKLVAGKVTLVHRRLWPELLAIGQSRAAWQTRDLSGDAASVLRRVGRYRRPVFVDELDLPAGCDHKKATSQLESRLLLYTDSIHTDSGAHAKSFETWSTWRRSHPIRRQIPSPSVARSCFESIVAGWPIEDEPASLLPWFR